MPSRDSEQEDYVDRQGVRGKRTRTTQGAISYAYEKYQEANGVMYHEILCQFYA